MIESVWNFILTQKWFEAATSWWIIGMPVEQWRKFSIYTMQKMIKAGFDVNTKNDKGATALIEIVATNAICQKEKIKLLIDAKADITIQNNDGRTALDIAKEIMSTNKNKRVDYQATIDLLEEYSKKSK